jgi:predicted metalloprotease
MRWEDFRQSENIEDRRGDEYGGGGGGMGLPIGGGGLGIGTIIVLGIIGYALGIDPRVLISGAEMATGGRSGYVEPQRQANNRPTTPPTDDTGRFVSAVVAQTEDVWSEVLAAQKGIKYTAPRLVLFNGQTASACGRAQSAMGPFYCPLDQKVYLDTSFFNDMKRRLGGGGDFAYAYVIAHEVGHHVENLLGVLSRAPRAQQQSDQADANRISVRIELMADCLAGVWAANADRKWQILEQGDVEKAINTAQAIGDDRLQQQARGTVVPDSFTHGSSAQRVQWLTRGLKSGQIDSCNTFARQQ